MKKYMLVAFVWFSILCIKVSSTTEAISYEIYMDTNREDLYEVKETLLQVYEDLMQGVKEESEALMIIHHLDRFAWEDNMQATWKNNRLVLIIGDGKGAMIEGTLQRNRLCIPEVKPKSIFQQWFGS